MRFFLFLFALVILLSQPADAGSPKDKELFDKASELTYEGQLKMAEKMTGQLQEKEKTGATAEDGTSMFMTMILGAIGTGYFIFGKKQSRFTFLLCGVGLMVFPFFVSDFMVSMILGLAMTLAPFKIEF
ncbi:MAG TPA: hypothetical protein PLK28_09030 [Candidatus Rifleibacterium sp.]|jgi:hypothetical protein|nr:hypothetical protein [Candidatus Rifleibacterium sp.]HOI90645.1 hypothetical protein [Candidatus Rifleibacterium sp.]